jgi:NO-binding membrane sensor protein with MHYT domain
MPIYSFSCLGIQKEEEGMYICTIKNQFGQHRLSAFVTVTGVGKYHYLGVNAKVILNNKLYAPTRTLCLVTQWTVVQWLVC